MNSNETLIMISFTLSLYPISVLASENMKIILFHDFCNYLFFFKSIIYCIIS